MDPDISCIPGIAGYHHTSKYGSNMGYPDINLTAISGYIPVVYDCVWDIRYDDEHYLKLDFCCAYRAEKNLFNSAIALSR